MGNRGRLLSDAMVDNVLTRLAESRRVVLPAMVTGESLAYFRQFLAAQSRNSGHRSSTGSSPSDTHSSTSAANRSADNRTRRARGSRQIRI